MDCCRIEGQVSGSNEAGVGCGLEGSIPQDCESSIQTSNDTHEIDVDKFYPSGTKDEIKSSVMKPGIHTRVDRILDKSLDFLLNEQYVSSKVINSGVHHVIKGTGQGIIHSGDTADVAFFNLAEQDFIVLESTKLEYGILLYIRFRDDIFIVFERQAGPGRAKAPKEFVSKFREKTKFYKLKVEETSLVSVTFLNMVVRVGDGRLITEHFVKPTSVGVAPLCPTSGQPWHVHSSWPLGQLKLIRSLCTFSQAADEAEARFRAKFSSNGITFPVVSASLRKRREIADAARPIWLPICYHSDYEACMKKALADINADATLRELSIVAFNKGMPAIRPAWVCDSKKLWQEIRQSNVQALAFSWVIPLSGTWMEVGMRRQDTVVVAMLTTGVVP